MGRFGCWVGHYHFIFNDCDAMICQIDYLVAVYNFESRALEPIRGDGWMETDKKHRTVAPSEYTTKVMRKTSPGSYSTPLALHAHRESHPTKLFLKLEQIP